MSRAEAERLGRWGERRAAWWLRLHGRRILDQRVRQRAGEIDLIARRGRTTAFIEVKTRTTVAALDLAIDEYRLLRWLQPSKPCLIAMPETAMTSGSTSC